MSRIKRKDMENIYTVYESVTNLHAQCINATKILSRTIERGTMTKKRRGEFQKMLREMFPLFNHATQDIFIRLENL